MAQMVFDCPHCGSEKVGFDFIAESPTDEGALSGRYAPRQWNAFLQCRHCNKGVVVELHRGSDPMTTNSCQVLW